MRGLPILPATNSACDGGLFIPDFPTTAKRPPSCSHPLLSPPLLPSQVCTTRKFFNILISVVVSGNPLLPAQWGAVGCVFTGLIASSLLKRKAPKHHAKHE